MLVLSISWEAETIKRQILITAHYIVEAEEDDFWNDKTGYLNVEVDESLEKQFPQKVVLGKELKAEKYSLSYQRIDYPNANILKCPICKQLITDMTKPNPIYRLDRARELEGVKMCSSCAWEMGFDIKNGRSIESILDKYR